MPDHTQTVAVISWGGQGLGLAIASRLIAEGCSRILITGRDSSKGEKAAAGLRIVGADVRFLSADLGQVDAAIGMIDQAMAHWGKVNALVNAAAATDRGSILAGVLRQRGNRRTHGEKGSTHCRGEHGLSTSHGETILA